MDAAGNPILYQTAVPEATSTVRSPLPYELSTVASTQVMEGHLANDCQVRQPLALQARPAQLTGSTCSLPWTHNAQRGTDGSWPGARIAPASSSWTWGHTHLENRGMNGFSRCRIITSLWWAGDDRTLPFLPHRMDKVKLE